MVGYWSGKHHSEETKLKNSISNLGKKRSKETKKKISDTHKGKRNGMFGKKGVLSPQYGKHNPKNCWGKVGMRKDLNTFFKSTWEANFARICNLFHTQWKYEPQRFLFPNEGMSYLPDFYLPEINRYVELSGNVSPIKITKLSLFAKYYPEEHLYHITETEWKKFFTDFSKIIGEWEK